MQFVFIKNSAFKILKSPIFAAVFFYLFFQLQLFNIGIDIQDEGVFSYGALNITQGLIPYKDFFLTPTPGSLYLLAGFMKVFGNYLILDRILAISFTLILLLSLNLIFKLSRPWKYLFLFCIAAISIHPTDFIGENAAIEILIAGLFFLIKGIDTKKRKYIFITGVLASLTFIFKQSFGFLTLPAYFLIVLMFSGKKERKDFVISYLLGSLIPLLIFFGYFYYIGALKQLIYYTFYYAGAAKGHQVSFLLHRIIFIPIFVVSAKVFLKISSWNKILLSLILVLSGLSYLVWEPTRLGRLADYLFDSVFYAYCFLTVLPLLIISFSKFNNKKERIYVIYSAVLLVLFLGSAASGYSLGPFFACFPLLIPLVIYLSQKYLKNKIVSFSIALIIIFLTLFSSFNPITNKSVIYDIFILNKYNYELPVKEGKFIRVTKSQKEELTYVINYVKANSKPNQKIFCFPLCPTMYMLSERNNSTFYNIIYPETFLISDQPKAIEEIRKNKTALILVMKEGSYFTRVNTQKNRYLGLYAYIVSNYKLETSTKDFNIYVK